MRMVLQSCSYFSWEDGFPSFLLRTTLWRGAAQPGQLVLLLIFIFRTMKRRKKL